MDYNAALAHFPKITYSRYKKLVGYFINLKNLWDAELEEMVRAGLEENIAYEFITWRENNSVEKILENLFKENIRTVSIGEEAYPRLLAEINDPPHTLFVRGNLPKDKLPTLAVVGTRHCTGYGRQICRELVEILAGQGMVIVSGLALGIDGIAHESALKANGITVAVLGSGINKGNIYPPSHQALAEKIIEQGGAVISEYPPGFLPTLYSFPARNRIIAGLSLGTLIIEAPEESGALITARCALDYNREVMALPHPITSTAGIGGNNLIKMGAKLINKAEDINEALNLQNIKETVHNREILPDTPAEAAILEQLGEEPKHIDEIIKTTGLDSPTVNSTLTMMEMKGMIKNLGGMTYVLGK